MFFKTWSLGDPTQKSLTRANETYFRLFNGEGLGWRAGLQIPPMVTEVKNFAQPQLMYYTIPYKSNSPVLSNILFYYVFKKIFENITKLTVFNSFLLQQPNWSCWGRSVTTWILQFCLVSGGAPAHSSILNLSCVCVMWIGQEKCHRVTHLNIPAKLSQIFMKISEEEKKWAPYVLARARNASKHVHVFLYFLIAFNQCIILGDQENENLSGVSNVYSQWFSHFCWHAQSRV